MKRFLGTAAMIAATCLSVATPAVAQSSADDARFAAAQARLDSELQIFRTEFDRYQSVRGNRGGYAPQGGYRQAPDRSGGYQEAYPDERDEGNYDPRAIVAQGRTIRSARWRPTTASMPGRMAAITASATTARPG
ncbi:hypothetical protein QP162_06445 [Sphingomonas aurantiaca]|uniref:hypothetical protein n=1 Tax=Sphingomonas aurantiaca TaxID=185949 RepID=UPI002FE08A38